MAKFLEEQFDLGDFVLVPVESTSKPTEHCKWRFVLLNEKLRRYPVNSTSGTYNELDGRQLEWRNHKPTRTALAVLSLRNNAATIYAV